jgi:Family of unknown function (DUF6790)
MIRSRGIDVIGLRLEPIRALPHASNGQQPRRPPQGDATRPSTTLPMTLLTRTIGWQTNGFRPELGFVCFGLGIAGVYASTHGSESWIAVTIPTTTFPEFAGVNHVAGMVRDHNVNP